MDSFIFKSQYLEVITQINFVYNKFLIIYNLIKLQKLLGT